MNKQEFQNRVLKTSCGCWLWLGSQKGKMASVGEGYGQVYLTNEDGTQARVSSLAHRVAYHLWKGDPGSSLVLHSCDVMPCVNPRHLSLGTHVDNIQQCLARKRNRPWSPPRDPAFTAAARAKLQTLCDDPAWVAENLSRKAIAGRRAKS